MIYCLCMNCGNIIEENFERKMGVSSWGYETYHLVDGHWKSNDDYEHTDSEIDEEIEKYCLKCDSEEVEEFDSEEEREIIIIKHTDKKGMWNYKELAEEEQNSELRNKYAVKKL